jgi:tetratricopeptide (TPR) repeat protein
VKVSIRNLVFAISLMAVVVTSANAQNSNAQSAIVYGNKLVAQGKYVLAIEAYRRVAATDGESYAQSIYNIGVCYYELWRTDEAISFYSHAIALRHGRYPSALYALGVALEDQRRFDEAKDAYRQSIKTSQGEFPLAHYRLGVLLANQGDLQTAANLFKEASKHRGEHVAASHNNLGVMLARMGRLDDAEKEFATALSRSGNGRFSDAEHNLKLCRSLRTAVMSEKLLSDKLQFVVTNSSETKAGITTLN